MNKQATFKVEGMTCGHCEMAVVKAVKTLQGVTDASASHEKKNLIVTHEGELSEEEVKNKVSDAGYRVIGR